MIRSLLLLLQQQQPPPGAGAIVASSWPSSLEDQPVSLEWRQRSEDCGSGSQARTTACHYCCLMAPCLRDYSKQASKQGRGCCCCYCNTTTTVRPRPPLRSLARSMCAFFHCRLLAGLLGLLCAANGRNSCFHMKELRGSEEKRMKTEGQC